jgi:hypothetical protein
MIERLGIADEINKKSRLAAGMLNATFVAKGEADLAVQLSSEILAVPGVQFVPMPPEFHASYPVAFVRLATVCLPRACKRRGRP